MEVFTGDFGLFHARVRGASGWNGKENSALKIGLALAWKMV
ncbi:hypothetical protein [Erythrobacter sp. JK5]|nr:hypothetical protein [Erythrobacter sp. JK5]